MDIVFIETPEFIKKGVVAMAEFQRWLFGKNVYREIKKINPNVHREKQ